MVDLPSKEELAKTLAEKIASIDWFVVDDAERWQAVAGELLDAILPLVLADPEVSTPNQEGGDHG